MTPDELLTTTRTVRRRLELSKPVSMENVKECLEIALQAPNGGDRQEWRWIVVTDHGLRLEIGKIYRRCFESRINRVRARTDEDSEPAARLVRSGTYLAENMAHVPVHVIPCLDVGDRGLPTTNQASVWASLLPAVWSYMLAARSRGLGTAWTTAHLDAESEVADLLDLPPGLRQAALVPTAHTVGSAFSPAKRAPVESVLHVNGWNRT
jgi:nitroreductase